MAKNRLPIFAARLNMHVENKRGTLIAVVKQIYTIYNSDR